MALQKLQALTAFLIEKNLVDENQIDSWMENGKIEATDKNLGNGIRVCRFRYDAVISIERFSTDEKLLLALVCVWLMDNDPEREDDELPAADIEVDIADDSTAEIEIKVMFIENIDLVEEPSGRVNYSGKNWAVNSVGIDIANEGAVGDDPNIDTDKSYVRQD